MLVRHAARTLLFALLAALLVPAAALALGLGDIHLESALNAPLNAQIDLVGASTADLETLKASLAPREDFARYGLDFPEFLGTVSLQPQHLIDGRNVIQVTSSGPATEPFASLLVQLDWAHGHVVREYTVLIDPPSFTGSQGNNAVAAPLAAGTAHSGAVQHAPATASADAGANEGGAAAGPGVAASGAASAAPAAQSAAAGPAAGGSYTVHAGDSLSKVVAATYGPGDRSLRQRQMVAIYRANPRAFNGNMNELLTGRALNLPAQADVAAISPADAAAELRQQTARWKGGAAAPSGGRLRLVPPTQSAGDADTDTGTGTGAGTAGSTAALQQQVQDLQQQLAQSKRLLAASNAQLAALQARVAARPGAAAPEPAPAPEAAAAEQAPAAPAPPEAAPTSVAEAPAASAAPAAPAAPATAAPATKPATAAARKPAASPARKPAAASGGEGILGLIGDYWYIPVAAVAILILLLLMRATRARQKQAYVFDRSLDRLGSMTLDVPRPASHTETVPVRPLSPGREEQSFLVEESGNREQPDFAAMSAPSRRVAIDDSVTGEAPVALDQGDPLAEADFHMAYGLYDQAAELVQIALSREPTRRDLKLKLLEVFFVWGNRDRFLQLARDLAASRHEAPAGEWEKTVIMGRQIAPDDPLFSGSGSVQGAASAGVDLNLEGGQNRVDFDLLGDPTLSPGHGAPEPLVSRQGGGGVELDLGAALGPEADLGSGDSIGESQRPNGEGMDFVLDDPERGNDLTGSTREMPRGANSGNTATVQTPVGRESDGSTVEQPQLHADNPTIREKLEAPSRKGLVNNGDQTAELALDDLGLDLGELTEAEETGTQEAAERDQATLLAGLDDQSRRLMAQAEAAHNEAAHNDAASDDEEIIFDDNDDNEHDKPYILRRPAFGAGGADRAAAAAADPDAGPTATGTWLFTDQDFSEIVGDHIQGGGEVPTELVTMITPSSGDSSPTSRLATLTNRALDLDLGATQGVTPVGGALDLDVGASANEATGEVEKIGDDMTLPDLEPVTLSEVGTKLDLARAYMDMGDPDGARSILQEVMTEGSGSQKQEARRLIDALPG